jgi:hypothetical protein
LNEGLNVLILSPRALLESIMDTIRLVDKVGKTTLFSGLFFTH